MNLDKLEQDWKSRGFTFGVGTIKAGEGVEKAVHDDKDEVVVMERGNYEFVLSDEVWFQEGEVEVYIPAGAEHSIKNIGITDAKIYYGYKSVDS